MKNILKRFNLQTAKEDYLGVINKIEHETELSGANLWILIFAIFVASLGLNVNSTAVIIGAMLISPLMGPIIGLGLGMGINDLNLMRRSLFNFLFATGISLAASTLYFSITPINVAHSEILARTSPNIYDVLIALFGGLAGIIALSFKHKGNVIPGVAIATALMPPLCTAGYGLATFRLAYFSGALYLFLINSVFIALATLVAVRALKFPAKKLMDPEAEIRAKRIAWVVVISTLLPSLYFGYDIVQQEKFTANANRFIQNETNFPNDYLLKSTIDARNKSILLTYGGKKLQNTEIEHLNKALSYYGLGQATLQVKQGFEYLNETPQQDQTNPLKQILADKEHELLYMKATIDSLNAAAVNLEQLLKETKALYPELKHTAFTPLRAPEGSTPDTDEGYLVYLQFSKLPNRVERTRIQNWLEAKLHRKITLVLEE